MRARAAVALALGLGVLAALAPSAPARADVADAMRPALQVYRDRDGLPQNSAMALAFAKDGSLWVGTQDGIASFDGTTWTQATLPRAEASGFVRTLIVDHEGALWVGRQDGGLARLRDGAWTTFDAAEGLPSPRVDSLAEVDEPGGGHTLWAGTRDGLARFEGGAWHRLDDAGGLPSEHVTKVLPGVDDDGAPVLWVGTDAGLAVVRGAHVEAVAGAPHGEVLSLLETKGADGAPELWMGGSRMPLGRRAHGAWTWIESPSVPRADVYALAATLAPDRTRVLWVGTDDGVVRLDHDRWVSLPDDVLPSRFVWAFGVPPSPGPTSELWIGSDTGLARLHTGGWRSVDRSLGLPQDSVYASLVTAGPHGEDELWVGTRDGGLSRYADGGWHRFGPADGFHAQTVFALAEHVEDDGTRHVYVGSQDAGLLRFDGTGFTPIQPGHVVRNMSESIAEDGRHELWVSLGDGGGVLHHVGSAWLPISRATGAPFDEIFATATSRTSEGHPVLWVATQGAGLARLEDGAWTTFDRASGALPTDSVPSVFVEHRADGHQEVWAGAEGGGVSRLDLDTPGAPWRTLSPATRPAIPDGTVYQVVADARGRIYLTTNKGVARLTRRGEDDGDFLVETFTTEDGLPANECNGGAASVDGHGRIWVGTIAGLAMLDPSREIPSPAPLLRVGARSTGSLRPLLAGETLDYDEASPSFDATLVSLFRGGETRYRTQVVGLDPSPGAWRADGHRELSSLPGGSYVFRAWAEDYRGDVHGPVEIPFRVRPAPWLTGWALALYAAAAALLVWATVRWRVRAVEHRNVVLEGKVADRTRELAVSEQRARGAEEEALRANHAKTTFLSTMSHELRTPLNAILGFAQLLSRDRTLSRDSKESVDVVVKSGEHLLGLINDVLSITKIEAGKLVLDESTFALADTVAAVDKMTRVRARSKRISLQVEVRAGMPAHVRGDEGKVRQILLNILGNAVKFTSEGGVAMRAWWAAGRAVFEVEDTGAGIAPDDVARLFEPFIQSDAGRRAKEGTGLGLFISRSYARLMGGDITCQSTPGKGTTFRVELALPAAEATGERTEDRRVVGMAPGQGPYRVLVVDDSPENRTVLARLLAKVGGFDVREAANGAEAIQVFGEHRPHVTWMDLRMDGVDGIAATQAIRSRERTEGWEKSVVLALSASAFDRDREWLLESGCDDFLAKPYREAAIFEALTRHAGIRFVHEGERSVPAPAQVTRERMSGLPQPLRTSLRTAARTGDLRAARDAVGAIAGIDEELAASLRAMVDSFRLEEIEAILAEHG
jgi:signal transduction histidine kinase/ligand-binding sensor domain-containing protein/CheY-like chemotaxis protein